MSKPIDPLYSPESRSKLLHDFRAADYEWRATHRDPAYYDFLSRNLPSNEARVLDVGCGSGRLSLLLAQRAASTVGLDLSQTLLTLAHERQCAQGQRNSAWLRGDIEAPPFRDEAFDYIVSCNVMRLTNLNVSLERVKELVAPGGRLALRDVVKTSRVPAPKPVLHMYGTVLCFASFVDMYGMRTAWGIVRDRFSAKSLELMERERAWVGKRGAEVYTRILPGCQVSFWSSSMMVLWDKPAQ